VRRHLEFPRISKEKVAMVKQIEAKILDGDLIIRIPANNPPVPSHSNKNLLVASTGGNVVIDLLVDGKPVTLGLNAYIKA
jgi:hypothetical protein